MKGLLLRKLSV